MLPLPLLFSLLLQFSESQHSAGESVPCTVQPGSEPVRSVHHNHWKLLSFLAAESAYSPDDSDTPGSSLPVLLSHCPADPQGLLPAVQSL